MARNTFVWQAEDWEKVLERGGAGNSISKMARGGVHLSVEEPKCLTEAEEIRRG